ncbi:thiamine pyrophosphokinase [Pelobium manganitolerans]|uniref:thiamine pyrophosphokinase n=1 Tax=Pelobium manganitolerans TaxID=1842495 RepID=UPI003FA39D81
MSSHHIVREKQEPALLILDLDGFDAENLGQLLEWSPVIIVPLSLYEKLWSMGIKVDVILAPYGEAPIQLQEHATMFNAQTNVLDAAFAYLIKETFPAVNVIAAEFNPISYRAIAKQLDLVVFAQGWKNFAVKSGFQKWKAAHERVRIHEPTKISNLKLGGLKALGADEFLTANDGFFSLSFDDDLVFISEEL